jgi:O-antigen/teichoic acid export membrane protein
MGDETPFGVFPERYLPLPDLRLPFTEHDFSDGYFVQRDRARSEINGTATPTRSLLGDDSAAGDVAVLTEVLSDYGDTGSLPPFAELVEAPVEGQPEASVDEPAARSDAPPAPPTPPTKKSTAQQGGALGAAAARGTSITLSMQGVRFVLQFISLVVLARLLTPSDFGVVAMVTSVVGVADILRDFGLSSAAIQAKKLNNAERTNLFWVNVGIGTAGAVVIMFCIPLIGRLYGQHNLTPIILSLAWVLIISGVNTQFNAELTRSLRFKALAFADIGAQGLGIAAAILTAVLGGGYWAIVVQQIVVAVMTLVFNMAVCRWRPGLPRRSASIRRFFRFGGGVLGTQLISYVTKNIDNVAVGAYWGAGPLGLYSRAYQLLMTPLNQINAPLTRVALPVLSRVQDDDVVYARYLKKAQLVGCYLTATVFALCAALATPMVDVLFGHKWHQVAPIFALLSIGGVFRSISQISYWIYLSRGKTGAQLKLYLVTRPIMIGIILAGLPWGPVGVAIGCSIAYFLYWVASLWHVGRATGIDSRPLFRNAARSLIMVCTPCGGFAFLGTLIVKPPLAQLAVGGALAAAYIAIMIAVSPIIRSDAQMIAYFVKRSLGVRSKAAKARHRAPSGRGASVNLLPTTASSAPATDRPIRRDGSHGGRPRSTPPPSSEAPRLSPTRASRPTASAHATPHRIRRASHAAREAGH